MSPAGAPVTAAATFCATLVDEWVRAGLTDAVVSPGSRSTPMALALAADVRLRVHVHHDERSAAFVALGMGLATGRPALVLTTSGTAAVEPHPAIIEAHHACVPLIALTADRPPELHNVGAPQTIDQQHLYGRAVRLFVDAGVPDEATSASWRPLAARVVAVARGDGGGAPGPVQVNLPFREPLVGVPGELPPPGQSSTQRVHVVGGAGRDGLDADTVGAVATVLRARRGVIVAGGAVEDPDAVHRLAEVLRWPVLADPRSGCRVPAPGTVSHADALLRVASVANELVPEVVLRLGELPASKVVNQWLSTSGAWQIAVDGAGRVLDPDGVVDSFVVALPGLLCDALTDELASGDGREAVVAPVAWRDRWVALDAEAAAAIEVVLRAQAAPTEPAVARAVWSCLPDDADLVVSSSMPVRDLEWYGAPRTGVRVLANRGANGIDGVTSTALGAALATGGRTALLIGDVAFLHDVNGLLGARARDAALCIVVVHNDGGGIFSFLPQASALEPPDFERLFGTPHGLDPAAIAAAYGLPAVTVGRVDELGPAVVEALAVGGVQVVVLRTDRTANVAIHEAIHEAVRAAVP